MLLVSGGDFYGGADAFNEPKCHFIARVMGHLRYDAVALGEKDLNYGLDMIEADNSEYGLNILCANLFRRTTEAQGDAPAATREQPLFPGYRIVERGGVRFGLIGAISPNVKRKRPAGGAPEDIVARTYAIRDPLPILSELVPAVKRKSDIVILVAHMELGDLDRILASVSGVDMVIIGHSARPSTTPEPVLKGGVPVYMASHQGQYVGRLRMTLDSRKKWIASKNDIRLLDGGVPDDPAVAALVAEFETENRRIQKELFVKEQLRGHAADAEGTEIYLGVGTCQRCHPDAFDVYVETRHARAYHTLSAGFNHRDSSCLPCHSTGYGERGGFTGTRPIGDLTDLVDVQCESCHGPGSLHSRDGRYREAAKESCAGCHTVEQDPTFDFEEAWGKIAH